MAFLPLEMLRSGASELGVELGEDQIATLDRFAELMVEANKRFNLTRIVEPADIVTGHFLDSLTCLAAFRPEQGAEFVDIGTGAGLPGLPIKIARPDLTGALVDSTGKKASFVSETIADLGLVGVEAIHARAEELSRRPAYRERYDVAYGRALADMRIVAELCLPLVKVGGALVAQKGDLIADELEAAGPIIGELGGVIARVERIAIPHTDIHRCLIVVRKVRPTHSQFPRPYRRIVEASKTVRSN